jgi:hypothetical protein
MSEPSSTAAGRARKPHQHVHLMADYGSPGVWDRDGAPLDPAALPLSPRLRARLARWCARFQESFETEIDLDAFASEGRAVAGREEGIAGLVDCVFRRGRSGALGVSRIGIEL